MDLEETEANPGLQRQKSLTRYSVEQTLNIFSCPAKLIIGRTLEIRCLSKEN